MKATLAIATAIVLASSAAWSQPAQAPVPIVSVSSTSTDPSKLRWLDEAGRKALGDRIASFKAGTSLHYVFAAGPGGNFWANRNHTNAGVYETVVDLARQALQSCEYYRAGPCALVSIDGFEAGEGKGDFPLQGPFLTVQSPHFDPEQIPFLSEPSRTWARGYSGIAEAKALVITTAGGGFHRTGPNVFEAVANAMTDCRTMSPGQECILYAINDRVAWDPPSTLPMIQKQPTQPAASPIVTISQQPTNVDGLSWLPEAGRARLTNALNEKRAGRSRPFAFAAAPGTSSWSLVAAGSPQSIGNPQDLARRALETCEYSRDAPCVLVSVDGFDTRTGPSWEDQPWLLREQPDYYDPLRIPFVARGDNIIRHHVSKRPRALAINTSGYFAALEGGDIAQAIANVQAQCKADNQTCLLYAVNERVVWSPYAPP